MPQSLTRKLIDAHLVAGKAVAGEEIGVRADQILLTDTNGIQSWLQFEAMGFPRVVPPRVVTYIDHQVFQVDSRNSDDHRYMQTASRKYGAVFSKPGNGICHQVHMETYSIPGQMVLGSDSHTPLCGAAGMLAIGAGGLDVAVAMGGGPYFLTMPTVVRVWLTGQLQPWVTAKDVILELLRRYSVRGGSGKIFEYAGPGVTSVVRGRRVHPSLSFVLFPGSHRILETMAREGLLADLLAAGVLVSEPSCGSCAGLGHVPATGSKSLRAFNRNFSGRSGVKDDEVYLCSSLVAAASAVTGVITDPRTLGAEAPVRLPERFATSDVGFVPPDGLGEVVRGPNIKPVPLGDRLAERLEAPVLLKLGDKVSTDDVSPAGRAAALVRSDVPAIAAVCLKYVDPEFVARAKAAGQGIIVGGELYGQGSSREVAAIAPMYLGVRAVIVKSFARIHRSNLINWGIVPLTFDDPAAWDTIERDDRLR